jgi:hypothetical protein
MNSNLRNYFSEAIKASIKALDKNEFLTNSYYHSSEDCTLVDYFNAQINNGQLYDTTDTFDEEVLVIKESDMDDAATLFEDCREQVVKDYLDEILENSDEIEIAANIDYDVVTAKMLNEGSQKIALDGILIEGEIDIDNEGSEFVAFAAVKAYRGKTQGIRDAEGNTHFLHDANFPDFLMNDYSVADIAKMLGYTVKVVLEDENYYFEPFDKNLDNIVEIVEYEGRTPRTRIRIKAISDNATMYDAFEIANRDYPCDADEEWDSFDLDFDENNEIVLHR